MSMFLFQDQRRFMGACGQTVAKYNEKQAILYTQLLLEEAAETREAALHLPLGNQRPTAEQLAEIADGALDVVVVAIGLLYSLGLDPQPLWNEVQRSNVAKIDPATGQVKKREDGKVLKPDDWSPPDLRRIIAEQLK